MNRNLFLIQISGIAVLGSTVFVLAYRAGGSRYLGAAALISLALLEVAAIWIFPDEEGPPWVTGVVLILPVLLSAMVVYLLARNSWPLGVQIAGASVTGLFLFVLCSFAAYFLYTAV